MSKLKLILTSVLLVILPFLFTGQSYGDEDKKIIRDNSGLVIGSTRTSGDRTIVRDSFGRNVGSVDKDGRITDNYGRLKGFVREKDD